MINYGTANNTNSLYYSSIEVLTDFINSVIAMNVFYKQLTFLFSLKLLMVAWKLPSSCLLNPPSASGCFMISVTCLMNFQVVFLFCMSLSSVCLFSILQLSYLRLGTIWAWAVFSSCLIFGYSWTSTHSNLSCL